MSSEKKAKRTAECLAEIAGLMKNAWEETQAGRLTVEHWKKFGKLQNMFTDLANRRRDKFQEFYDEILIKLGKKPGMFEVPLPRHRNGQKLTDEEFRERAEKGQKLFYLPASRFISSQELFNIDDGIRFSDASVACEAVAKGYWFWMETVDHIKDDDRLWHYYQENAKDKLYRLLNAISLPSLEEYLVFALSFKKDHLQWPRGVMGLVPEDRELESLLRSRSTDVKALVIHCFRNSRANEVHFGPYSLFVSDSFLTCQARYAEPLV